MSLLDIFENTSFSGIIIFIAIILFVRLILVINSVLNLIGKSDNATLEVIAGRLGHAGPFYPNGWLPIMDSDDLKEGQTLVIQRFGKTLLVHRDYNGNIKVLRANRLSDDNLLNEDDESNKSKNLECSESANFKSDHTTSTRGYHVREDNGFIYVWHHSLGKEPDWQVSHVHDFADNGLVYFGKLEVDLIAHIQDIMEKSVDTDYYIKRTRTITCGLGKVLHWWKAYEGKLKHMSEMLYEPSITVMGKAFGATVSLKHQGSNYYYGLIDIIKARIGVSISVVTTDQVKHRYIIRIYLAQSFRSYADLLFVKMFIRRQLTAYSRIWKIRNHLADCPPKPNGFVDKYRKWYSQFYE